MVWLPPRTCPINGVRVRDAPAKNGVAFLSIRHSVFNISCSGPLFCAVRATWGGSNGPPAFRAYYKEGDISVSQDATLRTQYAFESSDPDDWDLLVPQNGEEPLAQETYISSTPRNFSQAAQDSKEIVRRG